MANNQGEGALDGLQQNQFKSVMTDLTINLNSMIIKTKMMHLRWQEGSAIIIKIKSHINNDLKLIRYRKSVIKLLWNRIGLNLKAIILCVDILAFIAF